MKKGIAILFAMFLVIALVACVGGDQPASASPAPDMPDSNSVVLSDLGISFGHWNVWEEPDSITYAEVESLLGSRPPVPEGITIGVIMNEAVNEYWSAMGTAVEQYAAQLGINVHMHYRADPFDTQGVLDAAQIMAAMDLDAYIWAPPNDALLVPLAAEVVAKGTPVLNTYVSFIESASLWAGALDHFIAIEAARETIRLLDGQGNVALAQGTIGNDVNTIRMEPYKAYIEKYAPGIQIVEEMPTEFSAERARNMTENMLTRRRDIDVIYCANDTLATGVVEALRVRGLAGGGIKVLAMDGTTVGLQMVKDGDLHVTYNSEPTFIGELSVDLIIRSLTGQNVPRVVSGPITPVTIDNVDWYLENSMHMPDSTWSR